MLKKKNRKKKKLSEKLRASVVEERNEGKVKSFSINLGLLNRQPIKDDWFVKIWLGTSFLFIYSFIFFNEFVERMGSFVLSCS